MIHTDADGSMVLLADVEERYEAILNLLKFVGILLVGIFLLDELAGRIHVVARIDAHFLTIESSHVGNVRIEVNIGYERSPIAVGTDAGIDVFHVLCLAGTLSGEAHQFSSACCTQASVSLVLVVVIDWMRIGLSPPRPRAPICATEEARRV
jgi:hypothetical protein